MSETVASLGNQTPAPSKTKKSRVGMMQSAYYAEENCRITIGLDDLESRIRVLSNRRVLCCPNCGSQVILKAGNVRVAHFAHWDEQTALCFDEFYEPDGPEHQAMKLAVLKLLGQLMPEAARIEMEVPIAETGQRADVLAERADGQRFAIEVQVSPLTGEQWQHRHQLYQSAKICDIWLVGQSRLKPANLTVVEAPDEKIIPGDYQASWIRHKHNFSELERAVGATTRRIHFLDVLTDPITPKLTTICQLDLAVGWGLRYEFPFDPALLRLGAKVGLITPYDEWAREKEKQKAREAELRRQEIERALPKYRRQLKLYIDRAIRRGEENLRSWQSTSFKTPQWAYLRKRYHLQPADLELWNTTVPGYRTIHCDPRLWMAYLYYETVHSKYLLPGPEQKEPVRWPVRLANWILRNKFTEYLDLPKYDGDTYLDPTLAGFAEYLDQLGLLWLRTDQVGSEAAPFILATCGPGFPRPEVIAAAKATLAEKEWRGFRNFLAQAAPIPAPFSFSDEQGYEFIRAALADDYFT